MEPFYILDIHTLPDPKEEPSVLHSLPTHRREKCLAFANCDDRKRSLGAGIITQQILKDFHCHAPLTQGANGKPQVEGIFFNLSHSGDYVIGVASHTPVGCDIEKMVVAPHEIGRRFFCDAESRFIATQPNPSHAFWQMWTLKESYIKMTGEGIHCPFHEFQITVHRDIRVYRNGVQQNCTFRHFIKNGYSIAICTQNP